MSRVYRLVWLLATLSVVSPMMAAAAEQEEDDPLTLIPRNHSTHSAAKRAMMLYKNVLRNHQKYCEPEAHVKHFSIGGDTLGFVTPWNGHGYTIAETFPNKFDFISPVWLQIRTKESSDISASTGSGDSTMQVANAAMITGQHDIDAEWMHRIRQKASKECNRMYQQQQGEDNNTETTTTTGCPRIVPRVTWEASREVDEDALTQLITDLLRLADEHDFDGYVMELFGSLRMIKWLENLAMAMRMRQSSWTKQPKVVIMVIPPGSAAEHGQWNPPLPQQYFKELAHYIHRFVVMTYDFSSSNGLPGPNAPIDWMEIVAKSIIGENASPERAKQLLLGIPMYGRDTAEPVTGPQFVDILKKYRPLIHFHRQAVEHYVRYDDEQGKHYVYYPTPYFLNKRLQLASKLNVGVALWELGQGLNYMYDLL